MEALLLSYLPILMFVVISVILGVIMLLLPFIFAKTSKNAAKVSQYECGFAAFGDSRAPFDIKFYIVAILFIIFDLEIAFLFPWSIALIDIPIEGFWAMMLFLGVLTIGFIYEWRKGALNWR